MTENDMTQEQRLAKLDARIFELHKMRHQLRNIPGHKPIGREIDAKLDVLASLRRAIEPVKEDTSP